MDPEDGMKIVEAYPTPGKTNLRVKCQTARESRLAHALTVRQLWVVCCFIEVMGGALFY